MNCPNCDANHTVCLRQLGKIRNGVYYHHRTRRCAECHKAFETVEVVVAPDDGSPVKFKSVRANA